MIKVNSAISLGDLFHVAIGPAFTLNRDPAKLRKNKLTNLNPRNGALDSSTIFAQSPRLPSDDEAMGDLGDDVEPSVILNLEQSLQWTSAWMTWHLAYLASLWRQNWWDLNRVGEPTIALPLFLMVWFWTQGFGVQLRNYWCNLAGSQDGWEDQYLSLIVLVGCAEIAVLTVRFEAGCLWISFFLLLFVGSDVGSACDIEVAV